MTYYERGKEVEALFAQRLPLVRWSTVEEDTKLHFDGIFIIDGQEARVDIKGHRATHRGESRGDMCWVELANVSGNRGWLFGAADIIAFQFYDDWLLISREKLITFILSRLSAKEVGKKPYCLYQRDGRKDIIVMVPYEDLKKI